MGLANGHRRNTALGWLVAITFFAGIPGAQAARRAGSHAPAAARTAVKKAPVTAAPAVRLLALSAQPAVIRLTGATAQQQLLVNGRFSDGTERDVTRTVRFTGGDRLCAVSAAGVVTPRGDGQGALVVKAAGQVLKIPVMVAKARVTPPTRFLTDVLPMMTKNGCNQGACHGGASGQGGFKLSLRGFDPAADYDQIAKEKLGRRITRADPGASLLLKKATAAVPHGGGQRFRKESEEYRILARWIGQGAPAIEPKLAVTDVTVYPAERVIAKPGLPQQLQVTAHYSDGTTRDVTPWARFSSNDDAVVSVDGVTGLAKAQQGGEAAVMVSYSGFVKVARLIVPVQEKAPLDYTRLPRANFIDDLVLAKLEQLRIAPSRTATDAEFLRRVYLDVIGALPTPEEARQFLADRGSDKRAKLIDALLERPEFGDYRALKLSDLLRVNSQYLSQEGADTFYRWIRNRTHANVPYDALVRELLTARGSGFHVGPANYYRINDDEDKIAEATSQTFLGVRLNCAKCHNHPFEKWQQKDYYSLAAFFARVGRKGGPEFGENQVIIRPTGETKHPKTGEVLTPKFLGGPVATIPPDADRRAVFAAWLTAPENLQFAQVEVNRLWADLFGRGIVDPVDDFRVSNPPSNEALLNALAEKFIELKYDVKAMVRLMLNSRAYQYSSEMTPSNERDIRHFARAYPKRLPAEALADALDAATGKETRYGSLPMGTRAVQLPDSRINSYLLDVFGRPKREIVCACERDPQPNLSQMLNLLNGSDLNGRISARDGRLAKLIQANLTDGQIVTELYLATLSRFPTLREWQLTQDRVGKSKDRKTALEDILWALLNSQEFVFNH
jgi:Protein of unknown function (DUF1549)/Protein of unknown function (DUF1553)